MNSDMTFPIDFFIFPRGFFFSLLQHWRDKLSTFIDFYSSGDLLLFSLSGLSEEVKGAIFFQLMKQND